MTFKKTSFTTKGDTPQDSVDRLSKSTDEKFRQLQKSLTQYRIVQFESLHAEPEKPRAGMLVYADGVNWDPGNGEGHYGYNGTDWEYLPLVGGGGGVTTFLDLTDTPNSFAGQAGKLVRVNVGETALEFLTVPYVLTTDIGVTVQAFDADLAAIAALTTTAAGRSILELVNPGQDRPIFWDDSASKAMIASLANIASEASPAAGDYLLALLADGSYAKINWSDLPSGGPSPGGSGFTTIAEGDWTSGTEQDLSFSDAYDEYELLIMNLVPGTDNSDFYLQVLQIATLWSGIATTWTTETALWSDLGEAVVNGAGSYHYSQTRGVAGTMEGDASNSATQIILAEDLGTNTNENAQLSIRIFRPTEAVPHNFEWKGGGRIQDGNFNNWIGNGQVLVNNNALTGIRLSFSGGATFASGHYVWRGLNW